MPPVLCVTSDTPGSDARHEYAVAVGPGMVGDERADGLSVVDDRLGDAPVGVAANVIAHVDGELGEGIGHGRAAPHLPTRGHRFLDAGHYFVCPLAT